MTVVANGDLATVQDGAGRATGSMPVSIALSLQSTAKVVSATNSAGLNGTVVKNSPGRVYKIRAYNAAAYPVFLKFYNQTGLPTPGATPFMTIALVPGANQFDWGMVGFYFTVGVAFCLSKLVADNDTTVLVAGDVQALGVDYI